MSLRGKKVFSLITGASRGLGKFVAESMAGVIGPNSTLLLIAQDPLALTEVKANINQRRNDIAVRVECCNLAAAQFSVFESLLKDHSGENEIFEVFLGPIKNMTYLICQ